MFVCIYDYAAACPVGQDTLVKEIFLVKLNTFVQFRLADSTANKMNEEEEEEAESLFSEFPSDFTLHLAAQQTNIIIIFNNLQLQFDKTHNSLTLIT